jgi:hypothetical protein
MLSRYEIEEILKAELVLAKSRHEAAKAYFALVCRDTPSGLPYPDGSQRIINAGRDRTAAQEAFSTALKRFNDFILHGKIPEHLIGR